MTIRHRPTLFLSAIAVAIYLFGGNARAEDAKDCAESDLPCWIAAMKNENQVFALKAAMALGRLKDAQGIPPLIEALSAKDEYLATAALHSLVKIGAPAAPALVKAASSDSAAVRKYAVYALGKMEAGGVMKTISRLAHDPDAEVRANAAAALGRLGDKSALFDLVELLEDRSGSVRLEAIRALDRMPDAKTAPILVEKALMDMDGQIGMEVAALLVKIGPPSVEPILQRFDSSPIYVKKRMTPVLGELGARGDAKMKKRVTDFFIGRIQRTGDNPEVLQAVCVGLGNLGGEKAAQALRDVIKQFQNKPEAADLVKTARSALDRIGKK